MKFNSFHADLPEETRQAVRNASSAKVSGRIAGLSVSFDDLESARTEASQCKSYVLDHLGELLQCFEQRLVASGACVHWAATAETACQVISQICAASGHAGSLIVKGKSMVTEEIRLNHFLQSEGWDVVETDLGEFVVQLDGDVPSHIVTPIIHKTKEGVAQSFREHGVGGASAEPVALTRDAREHLKTVFQAAKIGISGVNFGIAETGHIVTLENEGNNRLSTTGVDCHIAVMGIEKILPRFDDLSLFVPLLAGSATGQLVTTYVNTMLGPGSGPRIDGPSEVHVVLVDNGRTRILQGKNRDILKCIRCGACLNVCPVYRSVSGHAYGHVYPGPVGAVFAPEQDGVSAHPELPFASTLCGACEEVCPVKIPIPDMLLRLRSQRPKPIPRPLAWAMANDARWSRTLRLLPVVTAIASKLPPALSGHRRIPESSSLDFRRWWRERS